MQDTKIISVLTGKGGAGKTAISFNLAGALAELGNRVLLIDSDNEKPDSYGIYHQSKEDDRPKFNIVVSDKNNLREQIKKLSVDYDYIVFDTPPNYSASALRSSFVSDFAIIPASPSFSDEEAITKSIGLVNDTGKPCYILANKIMRNQVLSNKLLKEISKIGIGLKTHITLKVAIQECAYFGKYVGDYANNSQSHTEFKNLAKEIIEKCKLFRAE